MSRKIVINNSEKTVCKYFDNGYCRYGNNCHFWHLEENCSERKCENKRCIKRHPKPCSYFRRQKCKFAGNCKYKHVITENEENEENKVLKIKLKDLEEAKENLKKVLVLKDFDINAKKTTIKKNDEKIKNVMAENQILRAEVDKLRKEGIKQFSSTCKKISKN